MNFVYQNDRTAPRMKKGEFSKMVITRDLYKRFLEEFPEYAEMPWVEFYANWLEIAAQIRYEAIWNPLGVKLGSYTGELKLQYLPYKFKANHASEDGTPYLNLVTRDKVAKIKWERRWAVKFNKILQFYAFDETREMKAIAKNYVDLHPEKLRTARVTLGGPSVWRQKMNNK